MVQKQNDLGRYLPTQGGDFVKVVGRKAQLASRSCYPKGDLAAPSGERHVLTPRVSMLDRQAFETCTQRQMQKAAADCSHTAGHMWRPKYTAGCPE